MDIQKSLKRLDTLPLEKLELLHQQCVIEVDRYKFAIRNYPADRMEKYGIPFLLRLEDQVARVAARIAELSDGR